MITEKVHLKDVSYKDAQLLWEDPTTWINVGLLVICNVCIKMDSETSETYHALHENIFAPSFSHIH